MKRRDWLAVLGGSAVAFMLSARAQQARMPVIGFLGTVSQEHRVAAFRNGLSEVGYVEDQNVTIEFRWAEGHYERLAALATDLVRRQVSVLVAVGGSGAALAAKAATATIPIVFSVGSDPVKLGLVSSLSRPGGNATGVSLLPLELEPKQLSVLRELAPKTTVIAVLVNPEAIAAESYVKAAQEAARSMNLQLRVLKARNERDIDASFAALAELHAGALAVSADPLFEDRRRQLITLADRYAIPTIYYVREFVTAGGLASYGSDFADAYRQVGVYTGRILNAAKPADLPVLQPTKLELVINLKTARALGITIPQSLLLRADEVIQ